MPTDSIIDPAALNFPTGRWGTCVNGQTFQQEGLVSFRGWQYAAYFADGGRLAVARRRLPEGPWQVIRFADYLQAAHGDAHNVAVIGICPGDGTVHLSFDHHVDQLHYRRSIPGLALEPERHPWVPGLFGPITDELEPGAPLASLTYPQFVAMPQGGLQLLFRLGSSGNGDWHLAEYDPRSGSWRVLGLLLSRQGAYQHSGKRCAYPDPLRYGPDGRLHLTWCWREGVPPGDLTTNHDLHYASSDDLGRTWRDNQGRVVARLGDGAPASGPIAVDTPGVTVLRTRFLWGQMNTTTQWADQRGRVHVIRWQNPDDAAQASLDMNGWCYMHCWREADGTWRERRLPFAGRKPQIVLDRGGTAYVLFHRGDELRYHGTDHGGQLTVMRAEEAGGWSAWSTVYRSSAWFVGEPLFDAQRWRDEEVLSVYIQEKPVAPGVPSALHVIDISPG
jgi:hypothetical protein